MWVCDLICDIPWLKGNRGHLGEPTFVMKASSGLLKGPIDILLFADENALRHVRFVLHSEDQKLVQQCVNANIIAWVNSIEAGVILQTKRSFQVPKVDGASGFMTILASYSGGEHVTMYFELNHQTPPFDVKVVGASLTVWNQDLLTHLFYFRRMIDPALLLESRWHNAYKLFEWHFAKRHLKRVGKKNELAQSDDWKNFVNGYKTALEPCLKKDQTAFGLIESVRAMVVHAFFDSRSEEERLLRPDNLIRLTYPVMNIMAVDLLNSLKDPNVSVKLTHQNSVQELV